MLLSLLANSTYPPPIHHLLNFPHHVVCCMAHSELNPRGCTQLPQRSTTGSKCGIFAPVNPHLIGAGHRCYPSKLLVRLNAGVPQFTPSSRKRKKLEEENEILVGSKRRPFALAAQNADEEGAQSISERWA
ncbi:hypothetical protein L1049_026364 [Liquidambar formosana]|uniref:Uncharacterized protein n=1 Tax=Liquidambar formosana TaxID=63359 RepID=A0AAP0R6C8_LIQFO